MGKGKKESVATPELSGVVTVIGLKHPYIVGREYQMAEEHAQIIIQKQLVKLK